MIPPVKRNGSGFVNLNKVLNANKNSQVGSAVVGGVQNNVNNFRTGLTSAQDQFGKDVNNAALNNDANKALRTEVLSKIGTLGSKDQVAGVGNSAAPKLITQDNIDQYGKFNAGNYGGPQELAGGAKFLGQSQNLQGLGQATRSEGGRQGLLQSFVGGNQYTRGQQKLDSLLLGNQAQNLGAVNRSVQGIAGNAASALAQSRDRANLQGVQNRAFGAESLDLVNKPLDKQTYDLNELVKKYQGDQTTNYDNLVKAAGGMDASSNPYLQGLSGRATWNVDPSSFINQGMTANAGNVITAPQEAQLQALSRLAGKNGSAVPTMAEGDRYDPTKAVSFDKAGFDAQAAANEKHFRDTVLPNYNTTVTGGGGEQISMSLPDQISYSKSQVRDVLANMRGIDPSQVPQADVDNHPSVKPLQDQYNQLLTDYGANKKFK